MKKTLLIILPLLLIVGCSKKPEGVYNEEGEKDGKWTTWYEPANWYSSDSEKKSEGVYENGEKVGKWTYYHNNGNKKEEGETVNGKKVGKWTYYHNNGNKKEEGETVNSKKVGKWTSWYENGNKMIELNFKDGKPYGLAVSWYENGEIMSKGEYTGGRIKLMPDGSITMLDLSGTAVSKWRKKGKWDYYDKNGKKTVLICDGSNWDHNRKCYSLRQQSIYEYFGIE